MKNFDIYRFYKGEAENPYNWETQNAQHMFWGYESGFADQLKSGDFSPSAWVSPDAVDFPEWFAVLNNKPVDIEALFKLWLFHLLFVHLADKAQSSDSSYYNHLYWATTSKSQ